MEISGGGGARGASKKEAILEAAVRLAAHAGTGAATMRAIAREVGVTEAAIYRHYTNKEALWLTAYLKIVDELAAKRAHLAAGPEPVHERIRAWVRVTFEYFDLNPAGFTYAFLSPQAVAGQDGRLHHDALARRQMLENAMSAADGRRISINLALALFTGLVDSVPRQINAGVLPGPAAEHADEVSTALWRVFGLERRPDTAHATD